jgi:hypothetical protein
VLITSNRPVMEWGEVFGDQVVATAILDRLLHHSHVLTIRGDSYRLREKRRSGLLRPQAGGSSSSGVDGVPPPTPAKEEAMFLVDPARPAAGQVFTQGLGFADAIEGIAQAGLDQGQSPPLHSQQHGRPRARAAHVRSGTPHRGSRCRSE